MKTYRETMDELRFTEQEKEAMVDRLLERGGSRRKGLNLRCAAVAVAAAAVLTVGAGAAVVLTPAGEVFASVLGGAPAQTEILDWMGVPVGASDTHNGVTITADAIMGDTYSYAIVYSIRRDDGSPLVSDETLAAGADVEVSQNTQQQEIGASSTDEKAANEQQPAAADAGTVAASKENGTDNTAKPEPAKP